MAEERNQVTPGVSPLSPALPVATPMTSRELDDVATTQAAGPTGSGASATASATDVIPPAPGGPAPAPSVVSSDDPEQIRQQIERTREDMSDTLNELQYRLSPQHIAEQAKASVREATVGRVQHLVGSAGETASHVAVRAQGAADTVVEQVREHPLPVALAGAGAGLVWWLMRRSSSRQTWSRDDMYDWEDADATYDRDYANLEVRTDDEWDSGRSAWAKAGGWTRVLRDNPVPASIAAASIGYMLWNRRSGFDSDDMVGVRSAYPYDESMSGTSRSGVTEAARDVSRQAREKASAIGEQVSETARDVSRHARETASAIGEQVTDTVRSAQTRASSMSRDVSRRVQSARRRTSSQFGRWIQENPMAVGVAALAAGAVFGLSVPRTRAEDQVLGSSRDALMEKASDQAQQLKEQVREKVQTVASELTGNAGTGSTTSTTTSPIGSSNV